MSSNAEIRKKISAPLSSDPLTRQRQKIERKALILKMKNIVRQAPVTKPKSKPKVVKPTKDKLSAVNLAEKLRRRFPE